MLRVTQVTIAATHCGSVGLLQLGCPAVPGRDVLGLGRVQVQLRRTEPSKFEGTHHLEDAVRLKVEWVLVAGFCSQGCPELLSGGRGPLGGCSANVCPERTAAGPRVRYAC